MTSNMFIDPLLGGVLIGISVTLMLFFNGRVTGAHLSDHSLRPDVWQGSGRLSKLRIEQSVQQNRPAYRCTQIGGLLPIIAEI